MKRIPKIIKKPAMIFAGFEREFQKDKSMKEIPGFWDNLPFLLEENKISKNLEVGEYALCVDDKDKVRYIIATKMEEEVVPKGLSGFKLEECEWAVFEVYGPMPKAMQDMEKYIFGQWLKRHDEYKAGRVTIEKYDDGDMTSDDYHSQVWVSVKRRK